ncbi:triacylglycerol lipase LipY [Mycobacterium sp. ML4]
MSSVFALPEVMTTATTDVVSIGSVVATANRDVASATTAVLAAAEDEVSAAIASLFSGHGQSYQMLSAEVAVFHERFVQALGGAGGAYAAAESANATLLHSVESLALEIQQAPAALAGGFNRLADEVITGIFGAPAAPPFAADQTGTFTGAPSLITRLEEAAIYPVKPLLSISGLEPQLSMTGSPILSLLASDVPPLSWFIGNSPPPFLNLLLGETVSYTTSNGMSVVQITPAHPTGEYVVAIHGGAFILPPSFLHWIHYSVMSYQTGATVQVPIYPLLQQGGTAGLVVPAMANLISEQVALHGPANVSVIGDSAGGNLALAASQFIVGNGLHQPGSMVLLSPWLDVSMTNPNIALVQDPLLPLGPAQQIGRAWAGGLPINDYRVSPLYGSLTGLPPTYVYSGNLDLLSADTLRLKSLADAAHAPFNFVLANGQIHDWIILTLDGPQYWPQINQELGIAA